MKGPWKAVSVSLPDPGSNANHYDDEPSVSKKLKASKDLEANPKEAVGMFYGLEVLDGSMYEVRNNHMIIKKVEDSEPVKEVAKKHRKRKSHEGDGLGDADATDTAEPEKRGPSHEESNRSEEKSSKRKKKENDEIDQSSAGDSVSTHPINLTKKRKKKKKKPTPASQEANKPTPEPIDASRTSSMQTSWMIATGGVTLNEHLCEGLIRQKFETPTPIQAATLPAAIMGRRNIVGAAPTGSGKTLAYALPILQHILEHAGEEQRPLQALVLAPTRELALQVAHECEKLMAKSTATIVGGLAPHKQVRILEKRRPPIVIGTPGRLWELMSSREHDHLNDLSQLRFLVIDEADRMVQQGSFPQLEKILDAIHSANPMDSDDEEEPEEDEENDPDRMLGLPGIPGEARVTMLSDIMEQVESLKQELPPPVTAEIDDNEFEEEMEQVPILGNDWEGEIDLPAAPPVMRQTFVFSATLTLPPSVNYQKKKRRKTAKKDTLSGAIAEILEKAHASGKTKVVDLTSSTKLVANAHRVVEVKDSTKSLKSRLPPGLDLHTIVCTQKHKDSHLYAYLVTTAQGSSGPCLVFCNSIAAVKRVGTTLLTLKLPVRMLHANMPQKARFKAVESLRDGKTRAIVVSTDVAARGLDIPNVSTVIHYDVARGVDTFIHRAGRTARGMGENAIGSSVSIVASAEDRQQKAIVEELGKNLFRSVHLDGRLLSEAQERVNLASKIVACDEAESRSKSSNKWFEEAAAEADLELDDDLIDEGLAGGDQRDQQRLREAKKARDLLRITLAKPMVTQRFGKFLSCNSAAAQQDVEAHVVPLEASTNRKKGKRKRR